MRFIHLMIIEEWANNICGTIQPLSPEALFIARVSNHIVKISREVNDTGNVAAHNLDIL